MIVIVLAKVGDYIRQPLAIASIYSAEFKLVQIPLTKYQCTAVQRPQRPKTNNNHTLEVRNATPLHCVATNAPPVCTLLSNTQ